MTAVSPPRTLTDPDAVNRLDDDTALPDVTLRAAHESVTLNPAHALWIGNRLLATYIPGGFWAVKVRRVDALWVSFAVPRRETTGQPFLIGCGDDYEMTLVAGIKWADSATTAVLRMDRIVFAGRGDATYEVLPDFDPATLFAGGA